MISILNERIEYTALTSSKGTTAQRMLLEEVPLWKYRARFKILFLQPLKTVHYYFILIIFYLIFSNFTRYISVTQRCD